MKPPPLPANRARRTWKSWPRSIPARLGLATAVLVLSLHFLEWIPLTNGDLVFSPIGHMPLRASTEFASKPRQVDLARAAALGDVERVKSLIRDGADPNGEGDHYRLTPLTYTVLAGNEEGARALVEMGADPSLRVRSLDSKQIVQLIGPEPGGAHAEWGRKQGHLVAFSGDSPLSFAVKGHKMRMAKLLLTLGAEPNADGGIAPVLFGCMQLGPEPSPFLKLLIEHGGDPNRRRGDGATLVGWFLFSGQVHNVLYLLENGADPTLVERKGFYSKPYHDPMNELNSFDYNDAAMLLQRITGPNGELGGPVARRIWEIFRERGIDFPVYEPGCRFPEEERRQMTPLQELRRCHMPDALIEQLIAYHTARGTLRDLDGLPEEYAKEKKL